VSGLIKPPDARIPDARIFLILADVHSKKVAHTHPRVTIVPRSSPQCYARRVEMQEELQEERARAGLCADCTHARRIESDRGARFYLCELSAVDSAYRKYPALPMLRCAGYQPKA
jgi:hypothetical protein